MDVNVKIEKLRSLMKANKIDAYIIPSSDYHQSEYVADFFRARTWISGFTGSAGTVVITHDKAILWADGRYYIQAAKEIENTEIELYKMGQPSVPTFTEYLKTTLSNKSVVGFDGKVISLSQYKLMKEEFDKKGIIIDSSNDFIEELWSDRPSIPSGKVFSHDVKFAGKTAEEKLNLIREKMKEEGANYYIISSLDDIAWTLNLRGSDVNSNPVFLSFLLITENDGVLYVNEDKIDNDIKALMVESNVLIKPYEKVYSDISDIKLGCILLDPNKTNVKLYNSINNTVKYVEKRNVTTDLKAVKNETEISNFMNCTVRDGVAMVKFIKYVKDNVKDGNLSEISVTERLEKFRAEQEYFVETSFTTIAGYKDHAAMMHYSANEESNYTLKPEGMLLVDSGGQYYDGTTDITRTIVLGPITEEEKRDFTFVVKSNIALTKARFLYGATGSNLDIIARTPLWNEGIDYKCGTGPGVGFLLNVHEGPQNFSQVPNTVKLEPGMNITNEPGVYKEGKHGIRIENLLFVTDDLTTKYGGRFLKFEVATFCPIDLAGIDKSLLNEGEIEFINDYHRKVYELISPYLNEEEKEFLAKETRAI